MTKAKSISHLTRTQRSKVASARAFKEYTSTGLIRKTSQNSVPLIPDAEDEAAVNIINSSYRDIMQGSLEP